MFERLSLELETSVGRVLLIADPHIAFELPRGLRIRTGFELRLSDFVVEKDPDLLVILGDVKEPLSMKPFTRKLLTEFFSTLGDVEVWIAKGNHDGQIELLERDFPNLRVSDHFVLDGNLFLHGHTSLPDVEFERAFLGHIHPAVSVNVGSAVRKTKCYLKVGRFFILPTINPYIEGFDVRRGIKMVPFLKNAKVGEVYLPNWTYIGEIMFE
ncbi:metallophosphoesterase [Palaeococcus ferrophilus]|uniref:metallophosphoesterase n=1 Tax=Palaeococcus ferrophilus TaxID=83868 RepID=UPI0006500261|nr:metallophosphoesterase [Palaeococcus ferrophilus]